MRSSVFMFLFQIIPGDEGLLSLSLRIVSLLIVVVIVFEAALLPSPIPLLGPVVVVAIPGPGPGPGAPPVWTFDAKTSKVSRLSETPLPVFAFPLSVSRFGKFGAETVRGQAPVAAVFTIAATRTTTRSPKTWTARISVATRTRTIGRRHF